MLPLASLGTFINSAATLVWLTIVAEGIAGNHFFKEQYHDLHHNMNDADLEKTFGVDNREKVPEYEVIALYQSDEYGNKVENLLHGKTRARRATYEQNALYYNIQAFGRSMLLNVTRMKPLVSSNALIQTIHNDGTSTYKDIPHGLHYTGHVVSDPDSLVALRENKGLTGMISTLEDKFYIQPLPSHLIKSNILKDSHPHVIYRRSNEEEVSSDFHSSDDIVRSLNQAKPGRRWRQKRQAPHKFLEMALVADNFAISAYGKEKMVDHLLTVAHIVTQLFQDKSIGPVKITPVILRVVLKNDGFGYKSSSTKGERIRAFEKWVAEEFPDSDKDPEHPDAAVLITRRTTGGIASLGSTCAKKFGAALANDVGLGTAIIVAHELAHTMGVAHDSSPCANHKNIMASTIPSGPGSLTWSACSRKKIQEFLRCDGFQLTTTEWPQEKLKTTLMQNLVVTNKEHYALTHTYPYSYRSDCLNDFPPISSVTYEPKRLYGKLTGQIINRDEQCKAIHGPSFYACPQRLNDCGALGCTRDGYTCSFTTASPADGTRCGYRHWCINGECVDDGSPVIHGHWSSWSAFSQCTRPCGGGVQSKTRTCTNPTPKNGGRNCVGPNKGHWRICNPQPCPAGSKTYRQIQCEAIDPNYHAYYLTSAWCLLACKKGDRVTPQGKNVKDGTRCYSNPSKKDVCIQGKCMVVGCDNGIESGVKRDRCGFCGGDSSKCKFVEKFWNDRCPGFGLDSACNIFEVPVGASSVYVEQDTPDYNLLEVKNKEGRRLIHVPSWKWSRTVFAAGTTIHYYHEADVDINTIRIPGPTTEKLTVVFVPSGHPKTGVKYKMYDPNLPSEIGVRQVQWKVTNWGQCSRKCAQGKQERTVECSRTDDGSYLGDDSCLKKSNKPAAERSCNNHPCHPEWYKSEWSACSKSCGKGIQKRRIHCRRLISPIKHEILSDSSCGGVKPTGETQRSCNEINCPAKWRASAWSKCSSTCRGGVKKRSLTCKRLNYEGKLVSAPEILCYHAPKLQSTQQCNAEVPCPTSSPLVRYRGLGCFNDGQPHAIPHLVKSFRDHIDWKNMQKTVKECADYVYKHYPKSSVFGLQFYGECWSGSDAVYTYNRYGRSSNCWENVGKEHTVYVYTFD